MYVCILELALIGTSYKVIAFTPNRLELLIISCYERTYWTKSLNEIRLRLCPPILTVHLK